jgi:FkbM family methyltransferase
MKYSIIIPTYNHCEDFLKPCINSVLAHSQMDQVELIVVANGCVDGTKWYLDRLKYQFDSLGFEDHFKIVWSDTPLGFSKAVNAGINISSGERVILLNNDTILLGQQRNTWLERLNQPFDQDPQMGITGSLMLKSDETGREFLVFFCAMIDRQVITSIGLLDEEFGVGAGEDIDYCYRAESAGFKITCVGNNVYNSESKLYSTDFPIYHKAEGTMHDPSLVQNWSTTFRHNMQKLRDKYSHNSRPTTVEQLIDKLCWLKDGGSESVELYNEIVVNNGYRITSSHVRDCTVIDIGANQGMFSIVAAELGAAKVLAFEPVRSTFDRLQQNIARSNLVSKISAYKQAVTGRKTGPVSMALQDKSGHNSLYTKGAQSELVETISFAELIDGIEDDDIFLKMDCEGAEYDIVFDTQSSVFDRIKHIALEIHGDLHPRYKGVDLMQARLSSLGFERKSSVQIGMWWYGPDGKPTRWEPMPLTIDLWSRA